MKIQWDSAAEELVLRFRPDAEVLLNGQLDTPYMKIRHDQYGRIAEVRIEAMDNVLGWDGSLTRLYIKRDASITTISGGDGTLDGGLGDARFTVSRDSTKKMLNFKIGAGTVQTIGAINHPHWQLTVDDFGRWVTVSIPESIVDGYDSATNALALTQGADIDVQVAA